MLPTMQALDAAVDRLVDTARRAHPRLSDLELFFLLTKSKGGAGIDPGEITRALRRTR